MNELVTNALKHAFPGRHGTVEVALERSEDGGAGFWCRMTVSAFLSRSSWGGQLVGLSSDSHPGGAIEGVASLLRPEAGGACVEIAFSDEPESQE